MKYISSQIDRIQQNPSVKEAVRDSFQGFYVAAHSIANNLLSENPASVKVRHILDSTVKAALPTLILLYTILAIVSIVFFPVVIAMLFVSPGILWSVFSMVPLYAFKVARKSSPVEFDKLFIERMKQLDPELAKDMARNIDMRRDTSSPWIKFLDAVRRTPKKSFTFLLSSGSMFLLSFVPVVGSVMTAVGHSYIVSESLGAQMLEIYTKDYKHWDASTREKFIRIHKWKIFGFALPFTLMLSIPIIGPFLLGFAQAGAADLFHKLLDNRDREKLSRPDSSSSS